MPEVVDAEGFSNDYEEVGRLIHAGKISYNHRESKSSIKKKNISNKVHEQKEVLRERRTYYRQLAKDFEANWRDVRDIIEIWQNCKGVSLFSEIPRESYQVRLDLKRKSIVRIELERRRRQAQKILKKMDKKSEKAPLKSMVTPR
jgi:hypothetical protein